MASLFTAGLKADSTSSTSCLLHATDCYFNHHTVASGTERSQSPSPMTISTPTFWSLKSENEGTGKGKGGETIRLGVIECIHGGRVLLGAWASGRYYGGLRLLYSLNGDITKLTRIRICVSGCRWDGWSRDIPDTETNQMRSSIHYRLDGVRSLSFYIRVKCMLSGVYVDLCVFVCMFCPSAWLTDCPTTESCPQYSIHQFVASQWWLAEVGLRRKATA